MDLSVLTRKGIRSVINTKARDIDKLWALEVMSEHIIDETGRTDINEDNAEIIYVHLYLQGYVEIRDDKIVATPKGKALLNKLK